MITPTETDRIAAILGVARDLYRDRAARAAVEMIEDALVGLFAELDPAFDARRFIEAAAPDQGSAH